jgi:hypothetical protein
VTAHAKARHHQRCDHDFGCHPFALASPGGRRGQRRQRLGNGLNGRVRIAPLGSAAKRLQGRQWDGCPSGWGNRNGGLRRGIGREQLARGEEHKREGQAEPKASPAKRHHSTHGSPRAPDQTSSLLATTARKAAQATRGWPALGRPDRWLTAECRKADGGLSPFAVKDTISWVLKLAGSMLSRRA